VVNRRRQGDRQQGDRQQGDRQQGDGQQGDRQQGGIDESYLEMVGGLVETESLRKESAEAGIHEEDRRGETSETEKKTFGALGSAWIQVSVDETGQEATLEGLFLGDDGDLTVRDILVALQEHYGVQYGIDRDQLQQHFEEARDSVVTGPHVIARGTSSVPGVDGRIEYPALESSAIAELPDGQQLRTALEQTELAAVLKPDITAYLAIPGERLAVIVPPGEGGTGTDVYGEPRSRELGTPVEMTTGAGVEERDGALYATSYGYAVVSPPLAYPLSEILEVISPIWVAADGIEAAFIHYSEWGEPRLPQSDWLMEILQSAGVTSGILEPEMERFCRDGLVATQKVAVVLARGTPPVPGIDTRINLSTDYEKRSGMTREDGSINLRERNSITSVAADQLLGEVVPATQGTPGADILGREVATTDGQEVTFTAGDGVREAEEEGTTRFYAEIDGNMYVKGETLSVNNVLHLSGDVGYETGNIDTRTDIQVSGNVQSGFIVRSGGTITVAGTVDDGAKLNALVDIIVAQGIVGETTQVVALGDIETKFIQNSSVMARGNITVGAYVYNGRVRAGGEVAVLDGGGDRGGSIVGGECYATTKVSAKKIGSPTTDRTVVGVGTIPEDAATLSKLKKVIQHCETTSMRLMGTLGIQSLEASKIQALLEAAPAGRKKVLVEAMKKLGVLSKTKEQSESQQEELESKLTDALKNSLIEASETVFKDVQVKMGDRNLSVSTDLARPRFVLRDGGITLVAFN